jgi:hypothetical protein
VREAAAYVNLRSPKKTGRLSSRLRDFPAASEGDGCWLAPALIFWNSFAACHISFLRASYNCQRARAGPGSGISFTDRLRPPLMEDVCVSDSDQVTSERLRRPPTSANCCSCHWASVSRKSEVVLEEEICLQGVCMAPGDKNKRFSDRAAEKMLGKWRLRSGVRLGMHAQAMPVWISRRLFE